MLRCLPRISVQNRLSDDVVLEDDYEWREDHLSAFAVHMSAISSIREIDSAL